MLCETRTRPSNDAPSYLYVCLKIEPPHTESAGSRPFLWCLIFVCRENPRNVRQIIKSTQSAMITLRCSRGFSHTRPPEKSEQYSRHSYYMGEEGKKKVGSGGKVSRSQPWRFGTNEGKRCRRRMEIVRNFRLFPKRHGKNNAFAASGKFRIEKCASAFFRRSPTLLNWKYRVCGHK